MKICNLKNNRAFFKKILIINCLWFTQACTVAPGLKVSDSIMNKNVLNTNFNKPVFYTTDTGMQVKFENLNARNIPKKIIVKDIVRNNVMRLMKSTPDSIDYVISSGDDIVLNLWAYGDIFGTTGDSKSIFRVSQSGYINLPLIGMVSVRNKTENQLRMLLRSKYTKFLKHPDISAKVVRSNGRSYNVLGGVNKPGQFIMGDQPTTLISALGRSGGLSLTSDRSNISVIRKGIIYKFGMQDLQNLGLSGNEIYIKNNDVIRVEKNTSNNVYVLGEVLKPQELHIPETGMSLANVIGKTGGLKSNSASASKVYIVRDGVKYTNIYRIDLSDISNFSLANRVEMQANDTVFIDSTGLSKFNRVLSLLVPSVNSSKALGVIK